MTFYDLLEVQQTADDQTIKRAWARLVRNHPPDKDPETNQRLNEAKQTLLDSVARADYDAQLLFGDEIEELFVIGSECMENEDYCEAIRNYKEILAMHPGSLAARNMLALAYAYAEEFTESARQYVRLTNQAPASALYAANYAQVLWNMENVTAAETWFRKAVSLEPFNTAHHLSLARLFVSQDRYREAEDAIEAAVGADGQVDIFDIDALMELVWIYMLSKQKERIGSVAERIASTLPQDDPEARQYASYKFLRVAVQFIEDYKNYQDAAIFLRAARKIDNDFGEAALVVASMERDVKADYEADCMRNDSSIRPEVVPALVAYLVHARLGFEFESGYGEYLFGAAHSWPNSDVRGAVHMCRTTYPTACGTVEDLLERVLTVGQPRTSNPSNTVAQNSGGCIMPLVTLLMGAITLVFLLQVLF